MVCGVQDEILAHDGQADEAEVSTASARRSPVHRQDAGVMSTMVSDLPYDNVQHKERPALRSNDCSSGCPTSI